MGEVRETALPGVGVRYEFATDDGEQVGVLCHHSGRRELVVYDEDDPDQARTVLRLANDDARTLADLLGATQVTEVMERVRQTIEGFALEWIELPDGSPLAGRSIGDLELRSRTGASVVAVVRDDTSEPAPGPDFRFAAGDLVVAVGTAEGLDRLRSVLRG